jgi:adenine-specific DNA-methyltransferase
MTSNKPKFQTPDGNAENIAKLNALFPNVISEGKVNLDALRAFVGEEIWTNEAYDFTWVGKRDAVREAGRPIRKTLRPAPDESRDWDTTENLYIEGDNLDVLKLLQESYLGKVKMVYIDPPYNTGHDFVYRDNWRVDDAQYDEDTEQYDDDGNKNFKENTDSNPRFHSDWCSMIYPRLVLARNLLRDDGVIFVSIDFNETANMKKILDEVFGAENFQREIIWRIGWLSGYKTTAPNFIRNHDTVLMYSKSNTQFTFNKKYIENKNYKPLVKPSADVRAKFDSLGLNKAQQTDLLQFINFDNRPERYPIEDTWNCNEYDDLNSIAIVSFSGEKISKVLEIDEEFKGQKSVKMLHRILESATNDESIVLDFFSGTGSTAHAVMQLNAEDGGKRKFIMVQLPEECKPDSEAAKAGYANICEIGKERIRRAGDKIVGAQFIAPDTTDATNEGAIHCAPTLDIGFRVLKLDDSNMKDVYYNAEQWADGQVNIEDSVENIKDDRTGLDLLFGCLIGVGLPLALPFVSEKIDGFEVFTYNGGDLIACFDKGVNEGLVRELAAKCAARSPLTSRVVFRDESFTSSPQKINLFEIFKLNSPNTKVKVI